MAIDVHAHYVPRRILEVLETRAADFGLSVVREEPACRACLHFAYGLKVRPFFDGLLVDEQERIDSFMQTGVERQVLSVWTDIFAYGLSRDHGVAWHRLMNDCLAEVCQRHPHRFSMLASGALQDTAAAARELERCVREKGAIGAVVAANVEGKNLGELDLDEFWAAAVELDVPVFIHPAQPMPAPRTGRFGLNQVVHYTYDTTLTVGSLIFAGVLDRFPDLNFILSHGGGTFPYLSGRFDCVFENMGRAEATQTPSGYLRRFHYDSVLHDPRIIRFLADVVRVDRILLGSDDPFPMADLHPLETLRNAGFSADDLETIVHHNPRRLFRGL